MRDYFLANPLMKGDDLKPLQKSLIAARLYHGQIDGIFGAGTASASKQAKWNLGYPDTLVKPTAEQELLNYLNGSKELPEAYKTRRRQRMGAENKAAQIRKLIVGHCLWGVSNEPRISYAQIRPMENLNNVRKLPWSSDCSEFATTIYKWSGAPDPNGAGYNGYGYTGTMLTHGETVPLYQAKAGDLVIWGTHPGRHVCVVVEDGATHKDPYVVGHGSNSGPKKQRMSVQDSYQPRPRTIKNYLGD